MTRTIPEHPDYTISDEGVVTSHRRMTPVVRRPSVRRGYLSLRLVCQGQQTQRNYHVHTLVAAVFLGPRPPGMDVRHLDGDRFNNHASNLAYGTRSDNVEDSRRHGTLACGMRHPLHVLTDRDIPHIRHSNLSQRSLARMYGVSRTLISLIQKQLVWSHIVS